MRRRSNAAQVREEQSGGVDEHPDGDACGPAAETSDRDRVEEGRQVSPKARAVLTEILADLEKSAGKWIRDLDGFEHVTARQKIDRWKMDLRELLD